jgi:DNA-binding MarR family transcriptional regulator
MLPSRALAEAPERIGMRVTMVQLGAHADLAPRMEKLGLTSPSRIPALLHISANPGCSQSSLAEFTGLSRASAMIMASQLEKAKLIDRKSADARTNALYLTPRGEAVLEKVIAETALNEELIFGCLNKEEREFLLRTLEKIIGHIERTRTSGRRHSVRAP